MDKILFIDGHNAIWRANVKFGPPAFHQRCVGICEHSNSQHPHCQCGSPWNVEQIYCYGERYYIVFNFFRNLRPIIEDFSPDKCFFVLEGHPQFRYDLFAGYKGDRIKIASSRLEEQQKVRAAREIIVSLLPHLPITVVKAAKYEADDVVATLCDNLRTEDITVISSDSDFIQLLQRGYRYCQVYNPIKKIDMEAPAFPYIVWKCLAGDKSDSIPKLLSPKKAIATASDPDLLQKFLQTEENRANFSINRQLIEFRSIPLEELEIIEGQRNWQFLNDAFSQMKFETILRDYAWKRFVSTFDCIKY